MKQRIDTLLVSRGLVATRTKAQAMLMAGEVRVAGQPVLKPVTSCRQTPKFPLSSRCPSSAGVGCNRTTLWSSFIWRLPAR